MAAPSVGNESTTITMVPEKFEMGQIEQFSPVHRINGFPFRLRLCLNSGLALICDKSSEAELWKCTAKFKVWNGPLIKFVFCSWNKDTWESPTNLSSILQLCSAVVLTIVIVEDESSFCWNLRPPLDSIKSPDGILVIGEEKKELQVNKEFLASQSPYFDRLFFGDFKEKNMDKIPIGGVEYKEFNDIIKMVYGFSGASVSDWNVLNLLDLADRFELKIVEDIAVSHLLSENSSFSLAKMLLLSQERNIPVLKNLCLNDCKQIYEFSLVKDAPEYAKLSDALKLEILDRVLDLAREVNNLSSEFNTMMQLGLF